MRRHSGLEGNLFSLLVFFCVMGSWAVGYASQQAIEGFRDLKFGMTPQEVSALPECRSVTECLYELNDKNRYLTLAYTPELGSNDTESTGKESTPKLAKITIDMGHFTEEWYQQLQVILGNSYRLTHNLSETTKQSFLAEEQDELRAGYEDGQVLLKVVRRPFGNMTLKVIYQNTALAEEFVQNLQERASSSN